jgi:hypothetical protein
VLSPGSIGRSVEVVPLPRVLRCLSVWMTLVLTAVPMAAHAHVFHLHRLVSLLRALRCPAVWQTLRAAGQHWMPSTHSTGPHNPQEQVGGEVGGLLTCLLVDVFVSC